MSEASSSTAGDGRLTLSKGRRGSMTGADADGMAVAQAGNERVRKIRKGGKAGQQCLAQLSLHELALALNVVHLRPLNICFMSATFAAL